MAKLAGLIRIHAPQTRMIKFAGKAFVQVKTLVLLSAPLKEVKFAQLHDLGRDCIMGVVTLVGISRTLALHVELADVFGLVPLLLTVCGMTSLVTFGPATFPVRGIMPETQGQSLRHPRHICI